MVKSKGSKKTGASAQKHRSSSDEESEASEDFVVLFRTAFHNTIFDVLRPSRDSKASAWSQQSSVFEERNRKRPGWHETDSQVDWDFNWADVAWIRENYDHKQFEEHQKVNHFRNHYEITRKDLLVKNLKRMKRQLERTDAYGEAARLAFFPATYVLPSEYSLFLEEFRKTTASTWIMKPIGKAQGKGIFLFNKLSQISEWKKDHKWKPDAPQAESYVAQRYIDSPYLIGGKKFDMRLYVLVTSFTPLVVWIHRQGFSRFTNTRYSSDKQQLTNSYMHLTNYSIQKKAKDYNQEQGCKLSLKALKVYLMSKHGKSRVEKVFAEIQDLIIRSLQSVQQAIIQDRHSFELYGYDVLIDSDLKPWLIEVNASPSLSGSNKEDYALKHDVLTDLLNVVDLEGYNSGRETNIGGFDLVYDGVPVGEPLEAFRNDTPNNPRPARSGATLLRSYIGCTSPSNSLPSDALPEG